jgi:hypothetical protein
LIVSDQAMQLLPGTMLATSDADIDPKLQNLKSQVERAMLESAGGVNSGSESTYGTQASYLTEGTPPGQAAPGMANQASQQMTTTSISLPGRFRREGPTATVRSGTP